MQGPAGPQGPQGAQGAPGKDATAAAIADGSLTGAKLAAAAVKSGQLGAITVRSNSVSVPNNTGSSVHVDCNAGERLISGGADSPIPDAGTWVAFGSWPSGNGWTARAENKTGGNEGLAVYALCLEVG